MKLAVSSLAFTVILMPAAVAQRVPDVRVNASPEGTARSGAPQIAASGSAVYVVWEDGRHGPDPTNFSDAQDVYFNRSLDGGATWLSSDVRLNSDTPGSGWVRFPQIAASDSLVYVIWWDTRAGDPGPFSQYGDVYFNRSLDGGTTWLSSDVRLNTDPAKTGLTYPQIAASGSLVYVTWHDGRNDVGDIYFNRSLNSGTTWLSSDVRLNRDPVGSSQSRRPQVAAAGLSVYVAWEHSPFDSGDVRFNRSLDGGTTWLGSDVQLNTDPTGAVSSNLPQIAASGSNVYVTWLDNRNGHGDVYFNRSLDGGTSWLPSNVRLDTDPAGTTYSDIPVIAASGLSVYVAWADHRNSPFPPQPVESIHFNRSLDGGATWLASDLRLNTNPFGSVRCWSPRLAASGDSIFASWTTGRAGGFPDPLQLDVHFNRSLDRGTTWLLSDVRLNSDPPGAGRGGEAPIAASGCGVYVAWQDFRHDPDSNDLLFGSDVYFNIPFGVMPYGVGKPGSAGMTPVLAGTGCLNLGGVYSLTVSGALGNAPGLLALGLGPASRVSVPIPEIAGTLLVDPVVLVPFTLSGTAGRPGAGRFRLPISVPPLVRHLGANLNAQAGILDPGATFGISMTNGVEAWIL